jgi:hypothetical protein
MKNFLTTQDLKEGIEKKRIGSAWKQLPGHWGWVTGLAYGKTTLANQGEGGVDCVMDGLWSASVDTTVRYWGQPQMYDPPESD